VTGEFCLWRLWQGSHPYWMRYPVRNWTLAAVIIAELGVLGCISQVASWPGVCPILLPLPGCRIDWQLIQLPVAVVLHV